MKALHLIKIGSTLGEMGKVLFIFWLSCSSCQTTRQGFVPSSEIPSSFAQQFSTCQNFSASGRIMLTDPQGIFANDVEVTPEGREKAASVLRLKALWVVDKDGFGLQGLAPFGFKVFSIDQDDRSLKFVPETMNTSKITIGEPGDTPPENDRLIFFSGYPAGITIGELHCFLSLKLPIAWKKKIRSKSDSKNDFFLDDRSRKINILVNTNRTSWKTCVNIRWRPSKWIFWKSYQHDICMESSSREMSHQNLIEDNVFFHLNSNNKNSVILKLIVDEER